MKRKTKPRATSKKRGSSRKPAANKNLLYHQGDVVAVVGEEGPDYVYLYILKQNITKRSRVNVSAQLLKRAGKNTKQAFTFQLEKDQIIGKSDILQSIPADVKKVKKGKKKVDQYYITKARFGLLCKLARAERSKNAPEDDEEDEEEEEEPE